MVFWTFRRSEIDVINLYDALSSLMQVSTGGNMLNFGYWDRSATTPIEAQVALCKKVSDFSELNTGRKMLDVGSGFSEPASIWKKDFPQLDISCVNVNRSQLQVASNIFKHGMERHVEGLHLVNSSANKLPFADASVDRIIALESAQHFKPLSAFVSESKRILTKDGIFTLAIPVLTRPKRSLELLNLGILSFTWSSEHYDLDEVRRIVENAGLRLTSVDLIGQKVFQPLAEYYLKNRKILRPKILEKYPSYVESILFKSMIKMKDVSEKKVIEYALLKSVA